MGRNCQFQNQKEVKGLLEEKTDKMGLLLELLNMHIGFADKAVFFGSLLIKSIQDIKEFTGKKESLLVKSTFTNLFRKNKKRSTFSKKPFC